jgi:hypothetical protein
MTSVIESITGDASYHAGQVVYAARAFRGLAGAS